MVSPDFVRVSSLKPILLEEQMALQLTVSGSCTQLNHSVWADFALGPIKGKQYFDIANVNKYDIILGTLFLWNNNVSPIFNKDGYLLHKGQCLSLTNKPEVIKIQ
jgi:hypothetical protein